MMKNFVVFLCLTGLLMSCGPLKLGLGGPNVAANVQAGQSNSQTLGQSSTTIQTIKNPTAETITQDSSSSEVKAEVIEKVEVKNIEDWFLILLVALLLLGWILPTPTQIGQWFMSLFRRGDSRS